MVAYGVDPLTGKDRRRWHAAGHDRADAEAMATRLDLERDSPPPKTGGPITFGELLTEQWMPRKRRQVRATTAYRCAWFVDRYIVPAIGHIPLRRLRLDHLEVFYGELATTGGRHSQGLAPKTLREVHLIVRAALDLALRRELIGRNVADNEHLRPSRSAKPSPASGPTRNWPGSAGAYDRCRATSTVTDDVIRSASDLVRVCLA